MSRGKSVASLTFFSPIVFQLVGQFRNRIRHGLGKPYLKACRSVLETFVSCIKTRFGHLINHCW